MGPQDVSRYRSWLLSNPSAFVEGARGFCKQAEIASVSIGGGGKDEKKSLWDKIKPWVLALGGGYLALKAGEKWGRFAQKHNYDYGPVRGPIAAGIGAFLPPERRVMDTYTRDEV